MAIYFNLEREKNFPPLPKICPCGPCFYHDISIEIPSQFQIWVRYLYYLWLAYSITLFLNMIAALAYFSVDKDGAATFGLSIVYLVLFVPASYVCWFRPIYRAFSVYFLRNLSIISENQHICTIHRNVQNECRFRPSRLEPRPKTLTVP
ncbi:unnamed protein product, partial [Rotaria magnacalcarata]